MKRTPAISAAILAVAVAGCGDAAARHHHAVAVKASPPSCAEQLTTWRNSTTNRQADALVSDLRKMSKHAGLGAMQAAAPKLSADATAMLGILPPACIPGVRAALMTAMNDFIAAADSIDQGSVSGLQDADAQIRAGTAAFDRASRALDRWEKAQ